MSFRTHFWRLAAVAIAAAMLASCGGSNSAPPDPDPDPDPDPNPGPDPITVSIADSSVVEGTGANSELEFVVSLSAVDTGDNTVDFASTDDTAVAGSDYTTVGGSVTIAAGTLSANVVVPVTGDSDVEADETLRVTISNPVGNAQIARAEAVGTINDDDTLPPALPGNALNDTGVTGCSNALAVNLPCNSSGDGTDAYPGQDAEYGRDFFDDFDDDGAAGFIFSKLDASGIPLADQSVDYATTPWPCVRDEITGLVWEVKTNDGGLHDTASTFSWYNTSGIHTAGSTGVAGGGVCSGGRDCDTQSQVIRVNGTGLCGYDDWRIPTSHELLSIMRFGAGGTPYLDTNYFSNANEGPYWSVTTRGNGSVVYVRFSEVGSGATSPSDLFSLRLVRGGDWP